MHYTSGQWMSNEDRLKRNARILFEKENYIPTPSNVSLARKFNVCNATVQRLVYDHQEKFLKDFHENLGEIEKSLIQWAKRVQNTEEREWPF